jgi:hypothetical protein
MQPQPAEPRPHTYVNQTMSQLQQLAAGASQQQQQPVYENQHGQVRLVFLLYDLRCNLSC